MFKEQGLHTSIPNGSDLGVIRRIEVEKRKTLHLGDSVEEIALNRRDAASGGGSSAVGVEFNAVLFCLCSAGQLMERVSRADRRLRIGGMR